MFCIYCYSSLKQLISIILIGCFTREHLHFLEHRTLVIHKTIHLVTFKEVMPCKHCVVFVFKLKLQYLSLLSTMTLVKVSSTEVISDN